MTGIYTSHPIPIFNLANKTSIERKSLIKSKLSILISSNLNSWRPFTLSCSLSRMQNYFPSYKRATTIILLG